MLFRPQAQLVSSLVLGWFSACVAWCSSCLPDRHFNLTYVCSPLP